jgi:GNAT superfamily N-acetyltransferase
MEIMLSLIPVSKIAKSTFFTIRPNRAAARIRFRLAKPADLSELARLRWEHAESSKRATRPINSDFCESYKEFMLARLANEEWLVLVAETDGRLVGCVYLQKLARLPRPDRLRREYGCIAALFVQRDYRGKGLRAELLRGIAEVARAEGLEYVIAQPNAGNRSVFQLLGFRQGEAEMELCLK